MNNIPILIEVHDRGVLAISLKGIFNCTYGQSDLEHTEAEEVGGGEQRRRMLNHICLVRCERIEGKQTKIQRDSMSAHSAALLQLLQLTTSNKEDRP